MDLAIAIKEYLEYLDLERGCSEWTIRGYRQRLDKLQEFLTDKGVATVIGLEKRHVKGYLRHLRERGLSSQSVVCHLSTVKSLCKWLVAEGQLAASPAIDVPYPKVGSKLPPVLSERESRNLLAACRSELELAITAMLIFTGIRSGELVKLDLTDVDMSSRILRVNGKGSKQRIVPFPKALRTILRGYLRARPPVREGAFFISSHRRRITQNAVGAMVRRIAERVLHRRVWPHLLRHSCATMIYSVRSLREVQQLLGHSSPSTTARYAQVQAGSLRQTMEEHPLAGWH